jgi:hypothetical protein
MRGSMARTNPTLTSRASWKLAPTTSHGLNGFSGPLALESYMEI